MSFNSPKVSFVRACWFQQVGRVHVVEVKDDRLAIRLNDRSNFIPGARFKLVNGRIRNQLFEFRTELLRLRRIGKEQILLILRCAQPRQDTFDRAVDGAPGNRLPGKHLCQCAEVRIPHQRSQILMQCVSRLHSLSQQNVAFRQVELVRRLRSDLPECPVVGEDSRTLNGSQFDVPL